MVHFQHSIHPFEMSQSCLGQPLAATKVKFAVRLRMRAILHVAVLDSKRLEPGGSGVRLPMDALADAKAMLSQGCKPVAVSSDSEGEPMGGGPKTTPTLWAANSRILFQYF